MNRREQKCNFAQIAFQNIETDHKFRQYKSTMKSRLFTAARHVSIRKLGN